MCPTIFPRSLLDSSGAFFNVVDYVAPSFSLDFGTYSGAHTCGTNINDCLWFSLRPFLVTSAICGSALELTKLIFHCVSQRNVKLHFANLSTIADPKQHEKSTANALAHNTNKTKQNMARPGGTRGAIE